MRSGPGGWAEGCGGLGALPPAATPDPAALAERGLPPIPFAAQARAAPSGYSACPRGPSSRRRGAGADDGQQVSPRSRSAERASLLGLQAAPQRPAGAQQPPRSTSPSAGVRPGGREPAPTPFFCPLLLGSPGPRPSTPFQPRPLTLHRISPALGPHCMPLRGRGKPEGVAPESSWRSRPGAPWIAS